VFEITHVRAEIGYDVQTDKRLLEVAVAFNDGEQKYLKADPTSWESVVGGLRELASLIEAKALVVRE
jgi:hypothetical protein